MTCSRHEQKTDPRLHPQNTDNAPDADIGSGGLWEAICRGVPSCAWVRGLQCGECRRERRAQQRITRGVAQMQADTIPDATLNRLLDALGLPSISPLNEQERARLKTNLRGLLLLLGLILFITTLAQPELIGRMDMEKRWFGSVTPDALQSARLWLGMAVFWYLKPLLALLVSGAARSPRMRGAFLTLGALGAAGLWLLLPAASGNGWRGALLVNIGGLLALTSVLMGGLLVEQGQRMGATGRLGALHAGAIFLARLASAGIIGVTPALGLDRVAWTVAALLAVFAAFAVSRRGMWRISQEGTAAPPASTADAASASANQSGTDRAVPAQDWGITTSVNIPAAKTSWLDASLADLRGLLRAKNVWAAGIAFLLYAAPNFTSLQTQENLRLGFSASVQAGLDFVGAACGLVGVGGYLILCRCLSLQTLLRAGIVCNTLGTLGYLGYRSAPTAFVIEGANGILSALVFAMLFDLAIRAIPRAHAMLGYALLTGVFAFASHLSNVFGSWLNVGLGWHFAQIVGLSAGLSAPALLLTAILPATLLDRREGKIHIGGMAGEPSRAGVPLWGHQ